MLQEASSLANSRDIASSHLRRSIFMTGERTRARVEADASLSWVYGSPPGRLLFGRGFTELMKVQAGLKIPVKHKETRVRVSPSEVAFTTQNDPMVVSHSIRLVEENAQGYARRLTLANRTESGIRLRLLSVHDPTSINFRRDRDPPGEVGVNAFNRGDHVVMDDVGDGTGVRVIGFSARPSSIYMTKDRQRAAELLGAGDLPEGTSGISGGILILAQHDFDLAPGESADLSTVSLYHPSSLELALSSLASAHASPEKGQARTPVFTSSNPSVNFSYSWAKATLGSIRLSDEFCDGLDAGYALGLLGDGHLDELLTSARALQLRDGLLPHSGRGTRGAVLETALFLHCICSLLLLNRDKKLSRRWYPAIRKGAEGIIAQAKGGLVSSDGAVPDGWRRRLGSGYPTGYVTEVNVAAARALGDAAAVAYTLGRGADAARFKDNNVRLLNSINERLRSPESGELALNLDAKGRLHKEVTVDQAVALSQYLFDHNLASSIVHRLLEKDFETGFGPRCVPTSNPLYYNPSYGEGQLGGYWTRGALAHALLAYRAGYPSIGSLQLEKVARLVHSDCERLGGVPGEFPYWLDPDKRVIGSTFSDPVASARFVEALVAGELGLTVTPEGARLNIPGSSQLRWFFLSGMRLGEEGSAFVGRSSGRTFVATTFRHIEVDEALRYHECERVRVGDGLECAVFWNPVSVLICLGNTSASPFAGTVSIPVKAPNLASSLFADLEDFDQDRFAWRRVERVRLGVRSDVRLDLRPSAWRAMRLVQITS